MFDITSQAVVDTAPVHLKGADGEHLFDAKGNPLQIVIFGPGSRQFAAIEARQTARAVKRMADNDGKPTVAAPEQRITEQAEDLAAITSEFRHFTYPPAEGKQGQRSEEHTSELQSLMRISYAVFCLKKKKKTKTHNTRIQHKQKK